MFQTLPFIYIQISIHVLIPREASERRLKRASQVNVGVQDITGQLKQN